MMNGHEKSDPAIVAMKLTNKAEPSVERSAGGPYAAESVEQRAGTKGNAGQQSMHRTQSRESVSQALERIRKSREKGRRRSSPRSSTTSTSIYSKKRSSNSRRMLHPAWIG